MKQVLQSLKTGEVNVPELPIPTLKSNHLLIKSEFSLVSLGTEKMLLSFGKANFIDKARQQPEKVKQVINKISTDGLTPTLNAVKNKLDKPLPLGYSNVGRVIEVGHGCEGYQVGDLVVSNGPHAEVVCVPKNLCAKVPDGVSSEHAAFTVVSAIGLQGIRLINPTLGETVVVMGLGLIGLVSVQILKANGCRVIGIDFDESKVELAKKYGADAFAINEGVNPVDNILALTDGVGADAVLITASTKSNDPAVQAPQMCRKRGRVVLVGVTGLSFSREDFYEKEISFQVSCSYGPGRYENNYEGKGFDYPIGFVRWTEQRNFQAILDLIKNKQLNLEELISKVVTIEEAPALYSDILDLNSVLGILISYPREMYLDKKTVSLTTSHDSSTSNVSIGLLGAGNFTSATLLPAISKYKAATKHTIASSGGVNGYTEGKKWGFLNTTTDYKSMLENDDINTIIITTKHNSHKKFVLEALENGKNVFVEKPLAITLDELEAVKDFYNTEKTTPRLLVGFNRRFAPLIKKAKSLLAGELQPKSMIMTVNAGHIPSKHWIHDIEEGGGRLIGEGCHFIDLLRYIAGTSIVRSSVTKGLGDNNDTFTIQLEFQDGSLGTIHYFSNGSKGYPKEKLEIFCAGKILELNNFRTLKGYGFKNFSKEKLSSQDKGHEAEIEEFLTSIANGTDSPVSLEEIFEVSRVTIELGEQLRC